MFIKERLHANLPTSQLYDGAAFARNIERRYAEMWENRQRDEAIG